MSKWYEWFFGGIGDEIIKPLITYVFNKISRKMKNKKKNSLTNSDTEPLDIVEGGINSPRHNECVNRKISCAGWINKISAGQHLWIVIEVGELLWPKEGEVIPKKDGTWEKTVFEDGNPFNDRFSIALYIANEKGHKQILNWFDAGRMTGSYCGLRGIPSTRRIDRIDLRLLSDESSF